MPNTVRLCLALHNHQPVGNFDHVMEQAYQDSYLPFLNVFQDYPQLRLSLHTSGPLLEWLDEHHSDYVDRLADFVSQGRIEIIGGAFYEPILTMIPSRDRIGQIGRFSRWLERRLGAPISGMWIPERVWEQSLTGDLADAGIRYTILDDFHFCCAGLQREQLFGHYVTENEGRLLTVFPGSERLRYLIPFGNPQEIFDYLRQIGERHREAVVVFGDDGEKFGTWPETKHHVYDCGWLRQFFDGLVANQDWLRVCSLSQAIEEVAPLGKIYLPEGSYREMTEWALPVESQVEFHRLSHELANDPRWESIRRFVRGGFWRNFKVKYPETDEMYSRMMMVSQRLAQLEQTDADPELLDRAQRELYRAQCNCGYWHGAFGGVYLPHLRDAVYQHLIFADNLLDEATGRAGAWVEAVGSDFNFDGRQEVRLQNDQLVCLLAPAQGGMLYELDVRAIGHNLGATLDRRPEVYHQKVRQGAGGDHADVASIHDRVHFKQPGLEHHLHYDRSRRKCLLDHFYTAGTTLDSLVRGEWVDAIPFADEAYEARLRRAADRVQVQLSREQPWEDTILRVTKGVTLLAGAGELSVAYLLEGVPSDREIPFGIEWNFAGLPAHQSDRYYYGIDQAQLGHLGSQLDLQAVHQLGIADGWRQLDMLMTFNRSTDIWAFPIQTVSQSEGGFELVHQHISLHPHWLVRGDAQRQWSVTITLRIACRQARLGQAADMVGSAV